MGLFLAAILLAAHRAQGDEFDVAARSYGVPVKVLRAIAQVESRNKHQSLRKNKNGTYDFGIMQINSTHWQVECRHLNVATVQGNVNCGALLLSVAYKHRLSDPNWPGRYHSKTPSRKSQYATLVRNILNPPRIEYTLYKTK